MTAFLKKKGGQKGKKEKEGKKSLISFSTFPLCVRGDVPLRSERETTQSVFTIPCVALTQHNNRAKKGSRWEEGLVCVCACTRMCVLLF